MTDRPAIRMPRAPRVPAHVGVLLGISTAAYAVTLAGVTGLQASSDAELVRERAPAQAGISDLGARNDQLSGELGLASQRYNTLADAYAAAGGRISDLEAALGDLATTVQAIDGVSRSLPSRISLPPVRHVTSGGSAPATSSTTGASGAP